MRIAVGSDHAGFHLKEHVKAALMALGHDVVDVGPATPGSVDYPQFAADAARLVAAGDVARGVLACGSGVGVAIVANKVAGVRAVNAHDASEAEMARRHNDANVVTLSGSRLGPQQADTIVAAFLRTEFEGGRHARRVGQISALEAERGNRTRRSTHRPASCYGPPPINDPLTGMTDLFTSPLAEVDPEVAAAIGRELDRQQRTLEMIASENFAPLAVMRGAGLGADQQVRRGLPGQALLRRLRARRRRSSSSRSTARRRCSAPSTPTCSRTPARQANAAVMARAARAGRHDPRPRPRRTAAT